jgi:hypothetical protein
MSRRKKMNRPPLQPTVVLPVPAVAATAPRVTLRPWSSHETWAIAAVLGFFAGVTVATTVYSRRPAHAIEPAAPLKQMSTTHAAAPSVTPTTDAQPAFQQPETFEELLVVPTADLGKVDLARMNLLCADGLPGSEDLNVPQCLATLDAWTRAIQRYTENHYQEFLHDPTETHTWAEYRMMIIMCSLSMGYRVHYDATQAREQVGVDPADDEPDPSYYLQSDVFFINGLLGPKRSGTCSSLPVLVAAIGQRLGYPVTLVTAFRHMFVRWDDGQERFNIETTVVDGLQKVSDEEYSRWPVPLTAEMVAEEGYLQPQSPAQELAAFLYSRSACLLANGQTAEAEMLLPKCLELVPTSLKYRQLPAL